MDPMEPLDPLDSMEQLHHMKPWDLFESSHWNMNLIIEPLVRLDPMPPEKVDMDPMDAMDLKEPLDPMESLNGMDPLDPMMPLGFLKSLDPIEPLEVGTHVPMERLDSM